jgi:F-type H+-transporting ATPase subunit gamma
MAQLTQLRQKIKSIQTTKKITHAVRLVSMSLYNRMDKQDAPLKFYTQQIRHFFAKILAQNPTWQQPVLFPVDKTNANPLIIIIATSKGLCGSLNANLFRYTEATLRAENSQAPTVIAIGQRAIKFVREQSNGTVLCTYPELNSNNFIALADDLIDKIINAPKTYSSVTFFHNVAPSFFMQKPINNPLIPMRLDQLQQQSNDKNAADATELKPLPDMIWEQPSVDILNHLALRYLRSSVIHLLFQSLRAEHAARFLAMENSTNNAGKYLDQLTLQMNKLRQSLITMEVAELSSLAPGR